MTDTQCNTQLADRTVSFLFFHHFFRIGQSSYWCIDEEKGRATSKMDTQLKEVKRKGNLARPFTLFHTVKTKLKIMQYLLYAQF